MCKSSLQKLQILTASTWLVVLASCYAALPARAADDKTGEAAAVIIPKEDGGVAEIEDVEGTVKGKGFPVVLVRPLVGDEPYWVQEFPSKVQDGQFTVRAHFGDRRTKSGTRFRIVIIVAPSKDQAAKDFQEGSQLRTLPQLPRSEPVTVKRSD